MLEPIMALEVVTPEEYMGDIIGDLNKRRGQVNDMDSKGNARIIKAKVPLSEQFGYIYYVENAFIGTGNQLHGICNV